MPWQKPAGVKASFCPRTFSLVWLFVLPLMSSEGADQAKNKWSYKLCIPLPLHGTILGPLPTALSPMSCESSEDP